MGSPKGNTTLGSLNIALQGLRDLLANGGVYLNPESGKERVSEWQLESDPVGCFIDDIKKGEVTFVPHGDKGEKTTQIMEALEGKILATALYDAFNIWCRTVGYARTPLRRRAFYKAVRQRNFELYPYNGLRHFKGLALTSTTSAPH